MTPDRTAAPLAQRIIADYPLAPKTTIGVGGAARYYVAVSTVDEVREALAWAADRGLPVFVLGGGSNIVVADEGFPGLVIDMAMRGWQVEADGEEVFVRAAAGERWDYLVEHAVAHEWAGLECLSGIPGAVGATPIQNVGAYGQQVSETIVEVRVVDRATGNDLTFEADQCRFGYRTSRFKTTDAGRFVIVEVVYRLRRGGAPALRYPELVAYLEERKIRQPTLAQVRGAVRAIRARKSMLVDPSDPDARSCGSFFVNPIVSRTQYEDLVALLRRRAVLGPEQSPPHFETAEGVKLSAAWLIEHAGLRRGTRLGPVGLSSKHALAIVNLGGAKARDVIALAQLVRTQVFDRFGVLLEPEPVFVGFSRSPFEARD